MNLTQEGVRVPFQIYPGIFVPAGTYNNAEIQPVIMTNQGRAGQRRACRTSSAASSAAAASPSTPRCASAPASS